MQIVSRLINNFQPDNYELSLNINRAERHFSGIVTIRGQIMPDTARIGLHAKDLNIQSVTYDGKTATFAPGPNDELYIEHADIKTGSHILVVSFEGEITDGMHGMYPCYYKHDGIDKELIATQFESHHAREVFPCIDEPEAKATFDVRIYSETDVTVLGNMPIKSQKVEDKQLVTTFDTTPRMSTYLLAFVIGELHKKTAHTKSGVEVNLWATLAQPADGLDFGLDIATRCIDFFDEYFGTPYPLPKSDHVALPDFSSAAMENWGLITYREMALVADPKTASISSKHYLAGVIAHELSHQWFGNLVTMQWWNDLWLNESFATIMASIAIDSIEPNWNEWLDFANSECIYAMRRDSMDGIQSVQTDVNHPDEISTLFDGAIVYAKGARLMRMVQTYIGDQAFQDGLRQYFADFKYQNTIGNDLWKALSKTSGQDITSLMNTWISQSGYPVVHIEETDGVVTLSQQQFFVGPHETSDKLWPITLNSNCGQMPKLLNERTVSVTRTHTSLLRLNVGFTAHFITHYSDKLLAKILDAIKNDELEPLDRLQLLFEQTMLARSGNISSAKLIDILKAYENETTESVWNIISLTIGELKKFVESDKTAETNLRQLAGNIARQEYERLGWNHKPAETDTDTKLRATIIGLMVYGEDKSAIEHAIDLYKNTPLDDLSPELRSIIISTYVRHSGDKSVVDSLLATYQSTASADLQGDITAGITSVRDQNDIAQLLDTIRDSKIIRPQDMAHWFVYILRGRDGREMAWQWLRNNWLWIKETFAGDKSYDDYPKYVASTLVTRQQLEQYRDFFTPMLNEPALKRVISVGIGEIEGRVDHIERDSAAVIAALSNI